MMPAVRLLTLADAEAYWHLRLEALGREPRAFGTTVEEHRRTTVADAEARLARPDGWTAGAFVAERLRGVASLVREKGSKSRHKAVVTGVYVGPECRRHGVGGQLMAMLVARARMHPEIERLMLTVTTDNVTAQALYRRLGFQPWGTERAALKLGSEDIDEDHLFLVL